MPDQTQQRRLVTYPPPKYDPLIRAYARVNNISESKAAATAIKMMIDNLPPEKLIEVKNAAEEIKRQKFGEKNSY